MEINVNNDINLSSIENPNQNDDFIELKQPKVSKKKTGKENDKDENNTNNNHKSIEKLDGEDLMYKSQLIKKITTYRKVFYEFLGEIVIEKLESKTIDELEGFLIQIKDVVQSRNIENNVNGLIGWIPKCIEDGGCAMGFELEGYAGIVNSNKEYYYTMQEIMIESNLLDNIKVDPKLRLVYVLGTSAYIAHQGNMMRKAKTNTKLNQTISSEKYNDL